MIFIVQIEELILTLCALLTVEVVDNREFSLGKLVIVTSKLVEKDIWVDFVFLWANSGEIAEQLFPLVKAETAILVGIVGIQEIFPVFLAIVAVKVEEDSEFVWADLLTVVDIVLLEDFDCVQMTIMLADWALFIAIDGFAEDALEIFKAKQVIVVSVVMVEHLIHGEFTLLTVEIVND